MYICEGNTVYKRYLKTHNTLNQTNLPFDFIARKHNASHKCIYYVKAIPSNATH